MGSCRLDHELRRYLLLNGYLAYINRDFENSTREDDIYRLGLGFLYRPSQYYTLSGEYVYSTQDSTFMNNERDSNQLMLRLTGRY